MIVPGSWFPWNATTVRGTAITDRRGKSPMHALAPALFTREHANRSEQCVQANSSDPRLAEKIRPQGASPRAQERAPAQHADKIKSHAAARKGPARSRPLL